MSKKVTVQIAMEKPDYDFCHSVKGTKISWKNFLVKVCKEKYDKFKTEVISDENA